MYTAKNVAYIIFSFRSRLSFQRLYRLFCGYYYVAIPLFSTDNLHRYCCCKPTAHYNDNVTHRITGKLYLREFSFLLQSPQLLEFR